MADKTSYSQNEEPEEHFEAVLPLPADDQPPTPKHASGPAEITGNTTLDLVRKKLSSAYDQEPSAIEEKEELNRANENQPLSKHQKFLNDLSNSGKSLPEIQLEWHEYYMGLPDEQKNEVWEEFNQLHKARSSYHQERKAAKKGRAHPSAFNISGGRSGQLRKTIAQAKKQTQRTLGSAKQFSPREGLRSLGFGLTVGVIVIFLFLFSFFNERFIAPFIQPSRTTAAVSLIDGGALSQEPKLIIPKINLEVPVVYGVTTTTEKDVQRALQDGVVHYADTALPGQNGNLAIVGHSSNNILNPGKYKFVFVLLHKLENGDTFYLQKDGKRYIYQVYKRVVVPPSNTSVLGVQDQPATATLITCDPPGTSANRLVVVGKQISPATAKNKKASSQNSRAIAAPVLPGNSPSLWNRLYDWLSR